MAIPPMDSTILTAVRRSSRRFITLVLKGIQETERPNSAGDPRFLSRHQENSEMEKTFRAARQGPSTRGKYQNREQEERSIAVQGHPGDASVYGRGMPRPSLASAIDQSQILPIDGRMRPAAATVPAAVMDRSTSHRCGCWHERPQSAARRVASQNPPNLDRRSDDSSRPAASRRTGPQLRGDSANFHVPSRTYRKLNTSVRRRGGRSKLMGVTIRRTGRKDRQPMASCDMTRF